MQLGEGQAAIAVGVAITERLEALDAKHSPRLATCLTGSAMNSVFAASLQSPTPQPCEARTRTTVHVQVCGQILRRLTRAGPQSSPLHLRLMTHTVLGRS